MKNIICALIMPTMMLQAAGCAQSAPPPVPMSSSQNRELSVVSEHTTTRTEKHLAREITCKIGRVLAMVPHVTTNQRAFAMSDEFKKLKDSVGRLALQHAFESARRAMEPDQDAANVFTILAGQDSAIRACIYYELDECRSIHTKLDGILALSRCGGELWGDLSETERQYRK